MDSPPTADQKLASCISGEGRAAGAHFIQQDAEGKEISACIARSAERLLGGQVCRRPQGCSKAICKLRLRRASGEFLDVQHLCQAEVQNLGAAAFGYKDVCRLNVAVDLTFLVRPFLRVRNGA